MISFTLLRDHDSYCVENGFCGEKSGKGMNLGHIAGG